MPNPLEILKPLRRNIDSIIGENELLAQLAGGRSHRIKYGVDCTAPDLHLGHAVNLWMMRHLQEHGHRIVFLSGTRPHRSATPQGRVKHALSSPGKKSTATPKHSWIR